MAEKSNKALGWVVIVAVILLGFIYLSKSSSPEVQPVEEVAEEEEVVVEIPDGPIILGAMTPLSGEAVVYGEPIQRATNLAVEEINAAGGVNGHELQLIWEDSKCAPQEGTTAAQKLVEVDQVGIVIGTTCSGSTLAAIEITEPAGVLLFSAAASSPDITDAGDFVFRTYPSDGIGGEILATYTYKELAKTKLAIISELTDYPQGLRAVFADTFTGLGGELVADETYATGDTDFRTQILKVKAAEADVVYVSVQTPISGTLILKQLKENGIEAQVVVNDVMISEEIISENEDLYTNIYGAIPELDETREVTARYLANYEARYGNAAEFPAYMASAYDQVFILAEAMSEVGVSAEALRDYLYTVENWPGALGDITIDGNGDPIIGYNIKLLDNAVITDLGAYTP